MKKKTQKPSAVPIQTAMRAGCASPFPLLEHYVPSANVNLHLYRSLREAVPVIDAAIGKLVRLTVGFSVRCDSTAADNALQAFLHHVPLAGCGEGLHGFLCAYLDQLLTYGTAVGEMVMVNGTVAGLYNAPLTNIELRRSADGFNTQILAGDTVKLPVQHPERILLSALHPEPGALHGTSLLHGLPFVSSILLKIFLATEQNWERVGNVRFAVTYKPQNDAVDRAYAKERAMQVAKEWSNAMQSGAVRDFVTVGDVSIQTIGADAPIPDSEVPVRQILEQILAKTGLPPFMLGLSWSSTERMSTQQADILTSELESYRNVLTPVLYKICRTFLRSAGFSDEPQIVWNDITLQDEVELARAKLYNAQAEQILQNLNIHKEESL